MQTKSSGSGLSEEQISAFHRDGFLVIPDVLSQQREIEPVRIEYQNLLQNWCTRWVEQQLLDQSVLTLAFEDQIIAVYRAGLDYCQPLDITLPPGNIPADTPFHAGPAIFNLMTAPSLLDCVESLLGAEITSNPIQHVRIKPPASTVKSTETSSFLASTNWHQDKATALEEADSTDMITAWIAISDATIENGCLQVIPGSHLQNLQPHCPQPQLGIPEKVMKTDSAAPLPVQSGGMVLFHPLTIHGSLHNRTSSIRWSFDLRFHRTGQASGRPMFPSFIARSRNRPETELRSAERWKQMWLQTREELARRAPVQIHRWSAHAEICA